MIIGRLEKPGQFKIARHGKVMEYSLRSYLSFCYKKMFLMLNMRLFSKHVLFMYLHGPRNVYKVFFYLFILNVIGFASTLVT